MDANFWMLKKNDLCIILNCFMHAYYAYSVYYFIP